LRRLMPRLLLRPLLLLLLLAMLLRRPVLLRLRWRWLHCALGTLRCRFRARLWLRRCLRLRRRHVAGCLFPGARLFGAVVLDVDDAALRVERRRYLVLAVTLAPAAATAAAIAPEAAPSATLAFRVLSELSGAVAVHGWLRITRIARLGRLGGGRLRRIRWCGGTLSFSVHLLSSVVTSSAGG